MIIIKHVQLLLDLLLFVYFGNYRLLQYLAITRYSPVGSYSNFYLNKL